MVAQCTIHTATMEVTSPWSEPEVGSSAEAITNSAGRATRRRAEGEVVDGKLIREQLGCHNPNHADYLMVGSVDELVERAPKDGPQAPFSHVGSASTGTGDRQSQDGDDDDNDDGHNNSDEERT